MEVTYIYDLHVPAVGEWDGASKGDPLHPIYGPLPQLVGLLECQGEEFVACLWDTSRALFVTVEMLKDEEPDQSAPMLDADEVYKMRGWFLQSYRWSVGVNGMSCSGKLVLPPEHEGSDELWERMTYRMIMKESVMLAATTPVGLG